MRDIFLPLAFIAIVIVLHRIFYALLATRPFIKSFIISWLSAVGFLALYAVTFGRNCASFLGDLLILSGFSYVYMDFLCFGEASIRIKILAEIAKAGQEGLTVSELLARYNARVVGTLRIERLLHSGHVRQIGPRLVLGSSPNWPLIRAKIVNAMRRILFGE